MSIEIKVLNKELYSNATALPKYATEGSAGIDLICSRDITIYPEEVKMVHTGLALHIGSGYSNVMAMTVPRSGLGTRGLVLANTVGIIDEDYQGELLVALWNRNNAQPFGLGIDCRQGITLNKGDRIAQLIFVPIVKPQFEIVEEFRDTTTRGTGGFNSTGR